MGALVYALVAITASSAIIGSRKWKIFYDTEKEKYKGFGLSAEDTIFPAWMAIMVSAYIAYLLGVMAK